MYCTAQEEKNKRAKNLCTILYGTIGHNPPTKRTNACFTYDVNVILGVTGHQWALRNTWCYGPRLVGLRRFTCFSLSPSLSFSLSLSVSRNAPYNYAWKKKPVFSRTDGRTVGETDRKSIVRYFTYGTNHKSYMKKKWRAKNLLYVLYADILKIGAPKNRM